MPHAQRLSGLRCASKHSLDDIGGPCLVLESKLH